MKKIFTTIGISLIAMIAIVASGAKENETNKITLTIAGRDGAYGDALQLAADEYQSFHPEVSFELLKLSGSDLFEKTVIDMKTNTGTYDIVYIDDTNITQYQAAGWLEDLDTIYKKNNLTIDPDLIEPTVRLGRYPYSKSGTLMALPLVGNVALFAYRHDLFQKYGDGNPETWTELLKDVKTIEENEPNIDGVVFRGTKGNPIVTGFLPIFWAYGGHVLDEKGNVDIDNQNTLDAINYFLELAKYAPKGVSMYQSTQVKEALYSGTAAVAAEVWPGWIGELENPEKSKVVGKVSVVKTPGEKNQATSMLGIWLAGISKSCQHKDVAFDFLTFISSKEMQTKIAEKTGIPPTRESVYQNASLLEKFPWYGAQSNALKFGVPRPRTDKWKQIEDILGTVLNRALIGELTAQEAATEAQDNITKILN